MSIHLANLKENPFPGEQFSWDDFQRTLLWWVLFFVSLPVVVWLLFQKQQFILFFCVLTIGLTTWMMPKNRHLAAVTLFVGFSLTTIGAAYTFSQPLILLTLCILPVVYGMVFGGIVGAATISGLGIEIQIAVQFLPGNNIQDFFAAIMIASLMLTVIVLLFRYLMVDALDFYFENYRRISRELEEARIQRVEYKQAQEDLIHANNELARLTKQLKALNQVAEEARKAKETFVATVSHELRTPLNMLIGFSEVISQSPQVYGIKLPPMLMADIGSIQRNSEHLLELVNDVLDLSQVDMGNLAISREWCSLKLMVEEAFEVIRPLFQTKKLFLTAEIPPDPDQIFCDPTRVREVIINLLSNAGRFTDKGGVNLHASVRESELVIAVQDTGPGISPENQARLFEPFTQLDSSIHRKYGGSGLGLAISKRFVEMHGGKMWLESAVGVGTTFFFSLPFSESAEILSQTAARWVNPFAARDARSRRFSATLTTPSPRCVVLEEGDGVSHLFTRYLGDVEIIPVKTIDQALETLNQYPSQMLIINHPDALDLLRSINTRGLLPFSLPVLAFWLPGRSDTSEFSGVNRFLIKPVSSNKLLMALEQLGPDVKTVLIVDDNPEIQQLYGRIISTAPRRYRVLRASSGAQGLEMLRKRQPDAVILDLVMPEINGFQVLAEKTCDPTIRDIPVLVITAQDTVGTPKVSEAVLVAREGGISPRDLLELVRFVGLGSGVRTVENS